MSRPIKQFWSYVSIDNVHLCWEWLGGKNSPGYGYFWHSGKTLRAHRFAYELVIGAIPNDLQLDHLCKNKSCVNPFHLEPVTGKENVKRACFKTHCKNGHPRIDNTFKNRTCKTCNLQYAHDKRTGST